MPESGEFGGLSCRLDGRQAGVMAGLGESDV